MVYVGVVASLLTIDMAEVEKAIRKQFAKKVKAANLNLAAAQAGFDYAKANLQKRGAFYIERMNKTAGKIIIDGNSAAALGCMFAGCTVVTWYPITPSSSLVETMIEYMKEYRIGPDGKATFAIVQAEDELAAIGMVIGAGWAGARSMTATAGPGISLMSEFAGLAYYVEVPGVIWDIQRVGPSTGLPTRTSQGDILSTAFLSHGDTKNIMLFPCSVAECFSMAPEAFNLAEQFQTLVFVMSDLDLGMNNWMSDPFEYPTTPINRGKVLSKEDLDRLGGFARYKDVDGDGIGYRTSARNHPSRGGLLRARQRPQRESAIQRARRRLRKQHGAPEPQVRNGALVRSAARDHQGQQTRRSESSATELRTGASPRAAINFATNTRSRPTICVFGPIRSRAKCTSSSSSTIAFTSSSRIATRRCSRCSSSISSPS